MLIISFHYANWCGACKQMKPVWNQVKRNMPGVSFREVDEDKAKTPYIKYYPTIFAVKNGGKRLEYRGGPDPDALYRWVYGLK